MIDWVHVLYYSINIAALLLSVMGLWFSATMPGFDQWNRRFFLGYFAVYVLCCILTLADSTLTYYAAPSAALHFVVVLECLSPSLPLPMLTAYLLYCCGENVRQSRLLHIVLGLCVIYFILLMSASFIGDFSYYVPGKWYYFGPGNPLPLLPLSLILLLNLVGVIRRRKRLSHKAFLAFLVATLPMTGTMLAQLFIDVTLFLDISFVISALAMCNLILSDQIERDMRQQQEIAQQRISVMVLQMRPHFIYNTLMCIYSLCNQDPKKARQVTLDFTNYLRNNFNAVVSGDPILFSRELEHTRAYLAVEQAEYEDLLFVEYDTPYTHFHLPPLTLQPIVENAVKHGMSAYSDPLHVSIRTRHTDSGAEVTVEDDGPGFDPEGDIKPHTTLENIQQRLEMMCHGKMTIMPREGGGTVVKVTIP